MQSGAQHSKKRRIGVLVERRYLSQCQPTGMCSALRARGHQVILIVPETTMYPVEDERWLNELDLVVARGRSWLLLCLLAWAEKRGLPTVNRRVAIAGVHNKAEMSVALTSGDCPTPRTFVGPPERLTDVPHTSYPLILKPIFGDNCEGLHVIETPEQLAALTASQPVALAQQYLATDGFDLKLYGIGEELWAVRKPSPLAGRPKQDGTDVEPLPLDATLQDLGRRCRDTFGLELFGVDCVETPDGPQVIEVNDFPNYAGVPDVDEKLADYVVQRISNNGGAS